MFKNKYLLICVFLFVLSTNSLYCHNEPDFQKKSMDKSTMETLIDLERKIFFSDNTDSTHHFLIRKAEIYKKTEHYIDVIYTLERLSFSSLTDSLKTAVSYEMSLASFMHHNYRQSIAYANQSLQTNYSSISYNQLNRLLITLSHNELEEYDKGLEQSFLLINQLEKSEKEKEILQNDLQQLYSEKKRPKHKNPAKAEMMSAIIPGLGQCYSGYYAEGIANFTLHALLLSISGYAVYKTYYLTSYFAGINMLIRFYQGGTRRSMYLANKRNYTNKKEYNTTLKNKIIEIY